MPNIQEIAASAQESAKKLGIKKFDIYGSSVDSTSVQVDQGEPKQVKATNLSGVTVRVWNQDNTMGVTSTTDVDPKGLELALKTAFEASTFGVKENVCLPRALVSVHCFHPNKKHNFRLRVMLLRYQILQPNVSIVQT